MAIERSGTVCPFCHEADGQIKAGHHEGVQRYKCKFCKRRYLQEMKPRGVAVELRQQALDLHASGLSMREVARRLDLKPRSVVNWVHAAKANYSEVVADPPAAIGEKIAPIRRATIHDVVELSRVSASTVSNYLNQKGRMSETTRERIRTAISELRFTPNSLAKAIRERRSYILGVVTFGLGDLGDYRRQSIVTDLLGGINRGAEARGYNVLLFTTLPKDRSASSGVQFLDGKVDGLIWVGPETGEHRHAYAAQAGLPVMALLARQDSPGIGYVDVDNTGAIQQVVALLVREGHRRIAYAGPVYNQGFLDRFQGYRLGLEAAGIPWDRTLVATNKAIAQSWIPAGITREYEVTIDRWLASPDPPTAIVLTTDDWGDWAIEYLRRRGRKVPDDIAVTGFDNIAHRWNRDSNLTSVAQDFPEMGRLGVHGLIDMIEGAPFENYRTLLPGKLIVRASSGKPQ